MHFLPFTFAIAFICNWTTSLTIFFDFGTSYSVNNTNIFGVYPGHILLGGLFPVHQNAPGYSSPRCGILNHERGIHRLEAMYYALDKVNEDTSILPDVVLGAETRDTCGVATYALEGAVQFVMAKLHHRRKICAKKIKPLAENGETIQQRMIGGVIGAASSSISLEVASLFRLFEIPQVSYASTSADLNDRERYNFFVRTVPPDTYQARAMIDIVKKFGWQSAALFYSEGSYGEKGGEAILDIANKENICIVSSHKVDGKTNYTTIMKSLRRYEGTHVVILFCKIMDLTNILKEASRFSRRFIWLASDYWGTRRKFIVDNKLEWVVQDAITLIPKTGAVPAFRRYFMKLNPHSNIRNPWFESFWEEHFNCSLEGEGGRKLCHKSFTMSEDYKLDDKVPYVIDAVWALAYALHDQYRVICPSLKGVCDNMTKLSGELLMESLKKVRFNGTTGPVKFDESGNAFHGYDIMTYRTYSYRTLGRWDGKLFISSNDISAVYQMNSTCGSRCVDGAIRIPLKIGPSCCFTCQSCSKQQYAAGGKCQNCEDTFKPNKTRTGCVPLQIRHLASEWVIVVAFLAGIGIISTCAIIMIFIYFNDTPIVRASARELSYPLLFGILMCYCLTYIIVSDATKVTCGITRFGLGFCFSICYGALFTKTNRLARIFIRKDIASRSPRFISPISQVVIICFIVFLEAVLAIAGLILEAPRVKGVKDYATDNEYLLFVCEIPTYDVIVSFCYNLCLIVTCTLYALRTRKIPTDFNEAKYLGFVMYTTCVIWIAYIPVYYGISAEYAVIAICMNIILSATSIVAGVFGPKVYIIIFRPARNMRSRSTVTFNQSYSGSNEGEIYCQVPRKMTALTNISGEISTIYGNERTPASSPANR